MRMEWKMSMFDRGNLFELESVSTILGDGMYVPLFLCSHRHNRIVKLMYIAVVTSS